MNKKIFAIRIIVAIFSALCATGISLPAHADGELFNVCFGSEPAIRGKLYSYYANGGILNVLQVLPNGILVKKNDMFEGAIGLQEKIIFIKMNTRGLSDGSQVPVGQYRCTGTVTYEAVLGASRTVPAFAELSAAEKEKIYQEEKNAEKERKEREIKEQPERKKMAEAIIGGIDLNMGCIRIEKSIAPSFEIRVKNFMWKKLVDSKASQDYLTFLNVADDIIQDRADYTTRFNLFPDEGTLKSVCEALKKHRFKCDFNKNLVFMMPNAKWKNFVANCKSGATIDVSDKLHNVFYHREDGSSMTSPYGVLVPARERHGLPVLGDELIVAAESIERYNPDDFRRKAEALSIKVEDREVALSVFRSEILAMDRDAWRKINEELIPVPHGAELERIRKVDNELRAAKMQNARQEFIDEVSKLSFCLGDYIFFQKGLLEYTHSVKMDEQWKSLAKFQSVGDWDGMARLVLGPSSDLSKAEQWVAAKKNLLSHEFKFTIFFTRDTGYYQRRKNGWAWRSFCFDDCLEISQKLDVSDPVYVYTSDRGDALFEEAKKSEFNILGWLNSHPADMTDHHIGGELRKKSRPGSRDVSELLKKKVVPIQSKPPARRKISSAEAHKDYKRYKTVLEKNKYPPEFIVVTNKVVSASGKVSYKTTKKTFKTPSKVRGLAILLGDPVMRELYAKYSPDYGVKVENFKKEWTSAGNTNGDPGELLADIERRISVLKNEKLKEDHWLEPRSLKELEKRRELYANRANGYDYKPDLFKKWSREDNQEIVFEKYLNAFESIYRGIAEATQ